jgi:hypothetical protein
MSLTTTANSTLFKKTSSEDSKSSASYPPLSLLGAHLEVLSHQIRLSLGPNPTVS